MTNSRLACSMIAGCCALLTGVGAAWAAPVIFSVPKLEGKSGQEVDVPITVKNAKGMSALSLRVTYDPKVLEVIKDAEDPDKGIVPGKILPDKAEFKVYTTSIPVHKGDPVPVTPGRLPLVFAGGVAGKGKKEYSAIQEDGTLVTIRFRVSGAGGQKTALALENVEAFGSNDMEMLVKTEPGEITVVSGLPWLWIAIAAGAVVLLLLLISLRKRKQEPQTSLAYAGAAPSNAPSPQPQGATFQYRCTKCGASLTLPVLMAGKQIQCSACGTAQVAMP